MSLQIVDISDPNNVQSVAMHNFDLPAAIAAVNGRYAYAGTPSGIQVSDLTRIAAGPFITQRNRLTELEFDLGTLQFSPAVSDPWTDLPAASLFPLFPIGEKGFFRVKVDD